MRKYFLKDEGVMIPFHSIQCLLDLKVSWMAVTTTEGGKLPMRNVKCKESYLKHTNIR